MTGTSPQPAYRAPRWMIVLLVASLGLNLLVGGAFVGAALRHDRDDGRVQGEISRDLGRTPFIAALDPDDRREMGRRLMRDAGPLRENRAELRERFDRLLVALRADDFDRGTVEALLAEQREVGARRLEIGERAILDRLEDMSPDERRAYADRLDRSLRRRP